jgi:hypothetical protein
MKTMILAAAAALALGPGSAYADAGGGGAPNPITFFTQLPGVIAKPTESAPPATTMQTQNGQPGQLHAGRSSPGTSQYQPQERGQQPSAPR